MSELRISVHATANIYCEYNVFYFSKGNMQTCSPSWVMSLKTDSYPSYLMSNVTDSRDN